MTLFLDLPMLMNSSFNDLPVLFPPQSGITVPSGRVPNGAEFVGSMFLGSAGRVPSTSVAYLARLPAGWRWISDGIHARETRGSLLRISFEDRRCSAGRQNNGPSGAAVQAARPTESDPTWDL